MKGKWKPYSQVIGAEMVYIAGRQLDLAKPLHGGNIEYTGGYTPLRDAIVSLCELLNSETLAVGTAGESENNK